MKMKPASAFIAVFLASQVLLPLRYYASDDDFDERFAWRMFSPIRMTACEVEWTEDDVPRPPDAEIQVAWLALMRRARRSVLVAYARARCADLQGRVREPDVRALVVCDHPDGRPRRPVTPIVNLCETLR